MHSRAPILRSLVAIATPLLLLGFPRAPEAPLREAAPPPPSVEELRLLDELAQWVGQPAARERSPIADLDLPGEVRTRRAGFELFRQFNHRDEHLEVLLRLPYGRLIQSVAEQQGLDGLLLAAVMRAESKFDPRAVSHRGALGLMQLMPETAEMLGVADPFDPESNLRGGARYLRYLLEIYGGDVELALAAYNAGPGTVARFGGIPPYRETRGYVAKVLASYVSFHRRLWGDSEWAVLLRTVSFPDDLEDPDLQGEATVALARDEGLAG